MMKIEERAFPPSVALRLVKAGVSPLLARVFAGRGIQEPSELWGSLEDLLPLETLTSCVEMAEALADAIQENKRLLIVADYDADGATACAVALRALRAYGANVGFIIPDRIEHGYGLTPPIVDIAMAVAPRPDFLITVDNGIASHAGIARANELGVEVLVTDHHLPAENPPEPPAARLIVNPNQVGCNFESKALAGCGVMWYVALALDREMARRGSEALDPDYSAETLLPIVAVGTVADVVAFDKNNRILVAEGLKRIRDGKSFPGLDALAAVAGRKPGTLSTGDVAFGIGPRINAAGRLESMDAGVDCLTTDSDVEAHRMAQQLHQINVQRREIEGNMVVEAVEQLLGDVQEDRYTAVLFDEQWHPGVIGIVAGRIKERIYRPTFAMSADKTGGFKGSGRSIPGFHLRDALDLVAKRDSSILKKFGGHAMAAGVTVAPGKLEDFSNLFEIVARELLAPADLNQVLLHDGALSIDELSLNTVADLKQYVWGQGFPEPLFSNVFRVVSFRKVGADKMTLRAQLELNGRQFTAIKFRHEDPALPGRIRAAYKLDANTYGGSTSLQLLLDHYEPA